MKDVSVERDFVYKPKRNLHIAFKAGHIYRRVTEFAARAIIAAGAGQIIERDDVSE